MFGRKFWIRFGLFSFALIVIAVAGAFLALQTVRSQLPQLITVKDYQPFLVSQVYDRDNKKIGEFYRERRTLVPYDRIPQNLVHAFVAAEDDKFFEHGGINYLAIARAAFANLRAGQTVQGASTITQQLAKTLLLQTRERTMLRKVKEALLAHQMEENLKKEEILYLYLNQIYFGQSAYGVENAAQTYFHKPVQNLELGEMAMLAGLPKAPTAYSPVTNPKRAKERQVYVLRRMAEVGFISKEDAETAIAKPVKVFVRETYEDYAPFYLETVRQLLVQQLGDDVVLDQGLRIQTSLDLTKQKAANLAVIRGLKELDKRQGYRGALKTLSDGETVKFLTDERKKLLSEATPERTILSDGTFAEFVIKKDGKSKIPPYMKINQSIEGVVKSVDDNLKYVEVQIPDGTGIIDFDTMKWARKPDTEKKAELDLITKPSQALKPGDVIQVRVVSDKVSFTRSAPPQKGKKGPAPAAPALPDFSKAIALELDQEPLVEGSLLSFDQQTQDVLAMVGGYSYARNEFNRALQAARQTGSSFKAIVYASALDKGYNPSSTIMDVPVVYEETKEDEEGQEETSVWKPSNHGRTFGGEMTFRNALVRSLNVPAVKVIEDVGVPWAADYARRFGIFSPLNMDFTLTLGSSSVTLYEMTKMFSQFGRMGKRIRPLLIKKVEDRNGKVLLENVSLDMRFEKEIKPLDEDFQKRRKEWMEKQAANPDQQTDPKKEKPEKHFFFADEDQLISPQTAYIMTSLLKGVVEDRHGTGGAARAVGHEVAGKTGTTNGYYDAWFIGFTAQIATGVWVGFDKERSLGRGEVGGKAALPTWLDYMKTAHDGLPQMTFPVPDGIVFANIDSDTGKLASATTKTILRQAFVEGTEPTEASARSEDAADFLKEDLTQ